jgi:hypothetical protein
MVSTQTVVINVLVKGGNSKQVLNNMLNPDPIKKSNDAMSRYVATLGKALISMAGVLVAFNLFITLPQLIVRGFAAIVGAAIKSADEVQRSTLTIASLLLTFTTLGDNLKGGFEQAEKYATRLNLKFAELAGKSLGSASDIRTGFQFFASRGGMSMVKDINEAAIATQKLVDLTIMYAGSTNKERQIQTEIPALLEGQSRAGATIARIVKGVVGDLHVWTKHLKTSKGLVAEIDRIFPGLAGASEKLAKTPTGLYNSITGSVELLNALAMKEGAFKPIINSLTEMRDSFSQTMKELQESPDKMNQSSTDILSAFAGFSAGLEMAIGDLNAFLLALTGSTTPAEAFVKISTMITYSTVALGSAFAYAATQIELLRLRYQAWKSGDKNMAEAVTTMQELTANPVFFLTKSLSAVQGKTEEVMKAMKKALSGYLDDKLGSKNSAIEEMDKQAQKAEKAIINLKKELALINADENKILKIKIEQNAKIAEANIEYDKVPAYLAQIVSLNNQITAAKIKQEHLSNERGTIQALIDRTMTAKAAYNEFAVMENSLILSTQKLNHELNGSGKDLVKALVENKRATLEEMLSSLGQGAKTAEMALMQDQLGELAVLDYQHLENLTRIREISTDLISIEERGSLITALQKKYDLEKALLQIKRDQAVQDTFGDLNIQLEKAKGIFTDLRSLEHERLSLETKLSRDTNLTTEEYQRSLALVAEIFGWKEKTLEMENTLRESQEMTNKSQEMMAELGSAEESFRDAARGTISWKEAIGQVNKSLGEMAKQLELNKIQIIYLEALRSVASGKAKKEYDDEIRRLEKVNLQLKRAIENLKGIQTMQQVIDIIIANGEAAMYEWGNKTITFTSMVSQSIVAVLASAIMNLGSMLEDVFTAAFKGESVMAALKKFLGQMLIELGKWAVQAGSLLLISGLMGFPINVGRAIAMIAAGAACIAAGVALSGGGGSSTANAGTGSSSSQTQEVNPYFIRQQDVAAQQGIQYAMNENTTAINRLNGEVSRLSKENGDVLVTKIIKNNPSSVINPIVKAAGGSYSVQKRLGGVLNGASV